MLNTMERLLTHLGAPPSLIAEASRFVKFSIVGLCTLGCYFAILFVAGLVVRSTALIAAISYAGSAALNYVLQRQFTFQSELALAVSFSRYVVMHALAMAVNAALAFLLIDVYALNFYFAFFIIIVLIAVLTFTISRLWVYADR